MLKSEPKKDQMEICKIKLKNVGNEQRKRLDGNFRQSGFYRLLKILSGIIASIQLRLWPAALQKTLNFIVKFSAQRLN